MKLSKPLLAIKALFQICFSLIGVVAIMPILLMLGIINVSVEKFNQWKAKK